MINLFSRPFSRWPPSPILIYLVWFCSLYRLGHFFRHIYPLIFTFMTYSLEITSTHEFPTYVASFVV